MVNSECDRKKCQLSEYVSQSLALSFLNSLTRVNCDSKV